MKFTKNKMRKNIVKRKLWCEKIPKYVFLNANKICILLIFLLLFNLIASCYSAKNLYMKNNYIIYQSLKEDHLLLKTSASFNENINNICYANDLFDMIGMNDFDINSFTNEKITVAIIDSGIYPHQDLTIVDNLIIDFKDFVNNIDLPYDDNGHGTAIAGVICGSGYLSKNKAIGITQYANILAVKVLDYKGESPPKRILEGINWIIDNKDKYNIRVLNISIFINTDNNDEITEAIYRASEAGIIVITSAGNKQKNDYKTYNSVSLIEGVITVGSINETKKSENFHYSLADYSYSYNYDGRYIPDLVVPGTNIYSIKSDIYYKGDEPLKNDNKYGAITGTSISAAIITGIVVNLIKKYPCKNNREIKEVLLQSCVKINDKNQNYFIWKEED